MRTTSEKYYAIRIGDPKRHTPYFKLGSDEVMPALFASRSDAKEDLQGLESSANKIVRVELREVR